MPAEEASVDLYARLLVPEEEDFEPEAPSSFDPFEEDAPLEDPPEPPPEGAGGDAVRRYLNEIGSYPLLTLEEEVELSRKIQEGQEAAKRLGELLGLDPDLVLVLAVARARVNDRRETPAYARLEALSPKTVEEVEAKARSSPEARRLYLFVREGEEARRRMILANLRLVVSVAKRYAHRARGMHFLDLIQEGNAGLLRATALFDWKTRNKFSTYATWWIQQAVTRALHDQNRLIRLPVHASEGLGKIQRARAELAQTLGREPTEEEVAQFLGGGWTAEKVSELLGYLSDAASLDAPVGDEKEAEPDTFFQDVIGTERLSPVRAAEEAVAREKLGAALACLDPREAMVLKLRYGLDGHPPMTLHDIGSYLGVTRERVRQLEGRALRKLKYHAPELRDFLDLLEE